MAASNHHFSATPVNDLPGQLNDTLSIVEARYDLELQKARVLLERSAAAKQASDLRPCDYMIRPSKAA